MPEPTSSITGRYLRKPETFKNMSQLRQSHAQVISTGLGDDAFALSRLLAFCSNPQRGSLAYSWDLFQNILNPAICIFNTMIKFLFLREGFGDAVLSLRSCWSMARAPTATLTRTFSGLVRSWGLSESGDRSTYGAKVDLVCNTPLWLIR
ncbi:hypothetical protein MLD38_004334 [Melastoma candidum]|uniref:Uncharacterized protein n=1 Tax=Melastoma candidum TaxID=119954 RepID=A0ACB9S4L3_9MYRT|nr:hypothetical protein MLD38_004334 [Melastoma candidum]